MANNMSQKRKRLNYKQYRHSLKDDSRITLNSMHLADSIPIISELLDSPISNFITLAANDCGYLVTTEDLIVNYVHPLSLKPKSATSQQDDTNWRHAINGKFVDEYWEEAVTEIETLESMNAWEIVDHEDDIYVIKSTWAFKFKRYPYVFINKFKSRLCARGDMQLEGVDFLEKYAPVFQWTTVRLMLILKFILGLKSKQVDVTDACLHAQLGKDQKVFVEMPRGFKVK